MTLANHPPVGQAPARRRPAGAPSLSLLLCLRRRLAARAAALAVAVALALAAPAAAQAATLVSNLGKSSGSAIGLNEKDVAVQFTTGGGSSFTAIVLDFSSAPSGVTVKVGTGQPHNLTSPVTLTNPESFASGNNTFTADAGTKLTASTTYWVVIEGTSGALWLTANDGEDTGAATGWSIADDARNRDAGLTGPFASTVLTNIPKFRVEGTLFTKPGKPAAPSVTTGSTTSLKVAWRAPASDGGDAITDYDVRWRERFSTTWNAITDTTSTATRATVTGLSAGKTYDVQVCAQNSVNSSACADDDWSPSTQGKTHVSGAGTTMPAPDTACSGTNCMAVPASVSVVRGPGAGQFTVSWDWSKGSGSDVNTWRIRVLDENLVHLTGNNEYDITKATRRFTLPSAGKPALSPTKKYRIALAAKRTSDNVDQSMGWNRTLISPPRLAINRAPPVTPTITRVRVVSRPSLDTDTPADGINDTYIRGDKIIVDVEYSEVVTVDTKGANANVSINLDIGGTSKNAPLVGQFIGGGVLRFAYTVAAGDSDTDGIAVKTASTTDKTMVVLGGTPKATIVSADTGATADRQFNPTAGGARTKVDGSKPDINTNVGPRVSSAAGSAKVFIDPNIRPTPKESKTLEITFDKALAALPSDPSSLIAALNVRASNVHTRSTHNQHPTQVALKTGNNRVLVLTLGTAVKSGDTVELNYIPVDWRGTGSIDWVLKDTSNPAKLTPSFRRLAVTNDLGGALATAEPPIPLRAGIAGTSLRIVFDQPLFENATPPGSAFRVHAKGYEGRNDVRRSPSDRKPGLKGTGTATVTGNTVFVTLEAAVEPGEKASVDYDPTAEPTESDRLRGLFISNISHHVNAMELFEVDFVHDVTAPRMVDKLAQVFVTRGDDPAGQGKSKIHLYYDEALDPTSVPAFDGTKKAFTLTAITTTTTECPTAGRTGVTFTAAAVEKNVLSLTTSHYLKDNACYTLGYTPGNDPDNPIRDLTGNAVAAFSVQVKSVPAAQPVPRHVTPSTTPTTLVSNLGQTPEATSGDLSGLTFAQIFTTASGTATAPLAAVTVKFASAPSGVTVKVGTGTAKSIVDKSGTGCDSLAADSCVTLTNPSSLAAGDNTFKAPSGTALSTSSSYFVVIEGSGGTIRQTTSNGEDTGGTANWSIGDNFCARTTGNFACHFTNSLKIRVERTPPEPTAAGFTVTGREVKLHMLKPLDPGSVPAPSAFTRWETDKVTVTEGGTPEYPKLVHNRIESVTVSGRTAMLHLEHPILPCAGTHPFRVSYAVPAVNPLQTTSGTKVAAWTADHNVNPVRNKHPDPCVPVRYNAANFNMASGTGVPRSAQGEAQQPVAAAGKTVTLRLGHLLNTAKELAAADFEVVSGTAGAPALAVAGAAYIGGGRGVALTLSRALAAAEAVEVRYTWPISGEGLWTASGGHIDSFTLRGQAPLAPEAPKLVASFHGLPASHDGARRFEFELRFGEEIAGLRLSTVRDALSVTGGRAVAVKRAVAGRIGRVTVQVRPAGTGDVTVALPATADCAAAGAICASGGRKLAALSATVPGPAVNAPATGAPTISGTAQVGGTLTASTAGIADANGLTNASFAYQWVSVRDGAATDIAGATGASYTLVAADAGAAFKVRVSFTDDAGNAETLVSAATAPGASRPNQAATGAPTVAGTTRVGDTLAASTAGIADADGLTNASFAYQWVAVRNGADTDIAGATGASYTLAAADAGAAIKVRVSFTDDAGNAESLVSAATAAVAARLAPLTASFHGVAAKHANLQPFTFEVRFSEEVAGLRLAAFQAGALQVANGRLVDASQTVAGQNRSVTLRVRPDGYQDITLTLAATTDCAASSAICTGDGRKLSNTLTATVEGPPPLTAALHGVPAEHDGTKLFGFEVRFNQEFRGLRLPVFKNGALQVTGGRLIDAKRAAPGQNQSINVRVRPASVDDVVIALPATTDCAAAGAICAVDGRMLSNASTATVLGPPLLSVADAEADEGDGAVIEFVVTLNRAASDTVTVDYATADGTATAGEDYTAASGTLTFVAGVLSQTVAVTLLDDAIDEGRETFTLTLSNPTGAQIADGEATGTIVNTDHMPKAWTARFGRSVAVHVVDAVEQRLEQAPSESWAQLGGHQLGGAPDAEAAVQRPAPELSLWEEADAADPAGQTMTFKDLLLASAFHLVSNPEDEAMGPRLSAWGRVATSGFDSREDKLFLDGTVTTATLGVDGAWKRWLTGLLLAYSEGDGSFTHLDLPGGDVSSSLTSVHPYVAYTLSDRVRLWGLVGYGSGALRLELEDERAMDTDLTMTMGALGVRGSLLEPARGGGFQLALRSDVLWMVMDSAAADNLAATEADASRLRLVLEGSRPVALDGGGSFTPSLEVGLRHDGGDADTGSGLEVGGSLRYASAWGLSIEASVRGLVAHEAQDYTEWGASGALRFDPGRQGEGLTASITPTWGAAASGMSGLWGQQSMTGLVPADALAPTAAGRLDAELGYGLATMRGRGLLTPYARVALTEGADQAWHLGTRLALAESLNFSLEASRRQRQGDVEAHELALRANLGF